MHPLPVAVTHGVPAVVVDVEEQALEEEQHAVDQHLGAEHPHHVGHEAGVEQEQRQRQAAAEQRGDGVGGQADLHELVRHVVVAVVAGAHTDPLYDQHEDRHGEHQGAEEQVHLGQDPDHRAAVDAVVGVVVSGQGRRRLQRTGIRHHALGGRFGGQGVDAWQERRDTAQQQRQQQAPECEWGDR